MNIKRKMAPAGVMVLAGALLLAFNHSATATCLTGCLTKGGALENMYWGSAPLRGTCRDGQELVTLCGQNHRDVQNNEAQVDFTQFCKAFEQAALPLPDGCPDTAGTHAPTDYSTAGPGGGPAPVLRIGVAGEGTRIDIGSNGQPYNLCDLITIPEPNPAVSIEMKIAMPRVYFHKTELIVGTLEVVETECKKKCEQDDNCAVARAHKQALAGEETVEYNCDIFHRAENFGEFWTLGCGIVGFGGFFGIGAGDPRTQCQELVQGQRIPIQYWFVRQPASCTIP